MFFPANKLTDCTSVSLRAHVKSDKAGVIENAW